MRLAALAAAAALVATGAASSAAGPSVAVPAGTSTTVAVSVPLTPLQRRVDLELLLNVSNSFEGELPRVRTALASAVRQLARDGVDLQVGVATAGTAPFTLSSNRGQDGDPPGDASDPGYAPSKLFARVTPVGPLAAALSALASVKVDQPYFGKAPYSPLRLEGQAIGIHQLLTGAGFAGTAEDHLLNRVAPGQVAGWRPGSDVRRVLVGVTDQPFDAPDGTPKRGHDPDFALLRRELAAQPVPTLYLTPHRVPDVAADLARLTTLTAQQDLTCGGYDGTQVLPKGQPLVCGLSPGPVVSAVETLTRPRVVGLSTGAADPVLDSVSPAQRVDGYTARSATFSVRVTCPRADLATTHHLPFTATADGAAIGTTTVTVVCGALAAVPPVVQVPPVQPVDPVNAPPAGPVPPVAPPAPAAPAAPAPALQVQTQVQQQLQVQLQAQRQVQVSVAAADDGESAAARLLLAEMGVVSAFAALVLRRRSRQQAAESRLPRE